MTRGELRGGGTVAFVVRFTKFWSSLGVGEIGERAAALGYDGLDLVVRSGHPIDPENAGRALGPAAAVWASLGLRVGMITGEVTLTDSADPAARNLYAAAAAAGVPAVKIGYFEYAPGEDFETAWSEARRRLAGFERLSRETGVKSLYHTHSGLCLGSNCAGLRHLLAGFEPQHIGAYVDLGHLAVNGEDARMGLPMIRPYLAALGAKDARHVADPRENRRAAYADSFVFLGQGAAEWHDAADLLMRWRFDGPISVHTEYTEDQSVVETVGGLDQSSEAAAQRERGEAQDLAYLRALFAGD